MKKITTVLTGCLSAIILAGCDYESDGTNATVLKLDNNQFQVIGTGSSESEALQSAITAANKQCEAQGKEAFVLTSDSEYHGVDENTALIINSLTTFANLSGKAPGYYPDSKSATDWRSSLGVRCGPQPS